jgi:hypothetical protein
LFLLGLDRLHLTPSSYAHLFCRNAGVSVCDKLVLIWLISNKGYQLDCPDNYFHNKLGSNEINNNNIFHRYTILPFGTFSHVLVYCITKNLATLWKINSYKVGRTRAFSCGAAPQPPSLLRPSLPTGTKAQTLILLAVHMYTTCTNLEAVLRLSLIHVILHTIHQSNVIHGTWGSTSFPPNDVSPNNFSRKLQKRLFPTRLFLKQLFRKTT